MDLLRHTVVAIALLLSGCASLNENQCRAEDWIAYGRVDGEKGYPAEYWREHARACREYGVTVDQTAYAQGRAEGLRLYCTPDSGYRAGAAGEGYFGVCEGAAAEAFKQQYALGRHHYLTTIERNEVQRELSEVNAEREADPDTSVGHTLVDFLGLTPESARQHELYARRNQLDDTLSDIDNQAPVTTSDINYHFPSTFTDGLGAMTGTFFGFGSGHVIQGRYLEKGWIFTASEVASLAALAAAPTACPSGANTCTAFAVAVPLLAFLGSKIWESVDVWRFLGAKIQGYPHLEARR